MLLPRQWEERKQRNAERHLLGTLVAVFRTELVTKAVNWNLADWLLLQLFPLDYLLASCFCFLQFQKNKQTLVSVSVCKSVSSLVDESCTEKK